MSLYPRAVRCHLFNFNTFSRTYVGNHFCFFTYHHDKTISLNALSLQAGCEQTFSAPISYNLSNAMSPDCRLIFQPFFYASVLMINAEQLLSNSARGIVRVVLSRGIVAWYCRVVLFAWYCRVVLSRGILRACTILVREKISWRVCLVMKFKSSNHCCTNQFFSGVCRVYSFDIRLTASSGTIALQNFKFPISFINSKFASRMFFF